MDNNKLKRYGKLYNDYINNLFISNSKYRGFDATIKWCFFDGDIWISATADRKEELIRININWFLDCINNNREYDVEYFLLHETRHVFQHIVIREYHSEIDLGVNEDIIKQWIKENNNYRKAIDKDDNENMDYFKQDIELDAYAYSFATMSYKYKRKYDALLYVPPIYKNELKQEFDNIVSSWKNFYGDL